MSFITLIRSHSTTADEPSDLRLVGTSIVELCRKKTRALADATDTLPVLTLQELKSSTDAELRKIGEDICNALAISEVTETGAGWDVGQPIGPRDCSGIDSKIKVKFVFEENDEIIIAVPDEGVIDYGLSKAPMEEPEYIDRTRGNLRVLADRIVTAVRTAEGNVVGGRVQGVIDVVLDELLTEIESDAKDAGVFFEQLGAYPIRQCG